MISFFKNLPKHSKSAYKNLTRHMTMTISCTLQVLTTLLLMSLSILLAANINSFTTNIEGHLKIHVALDTIIQDAQIKTIYQQIKENDSVKSIAYSSKEEELDMLIDNSGDVFARYRDHNPMSDVFIVEVKEAKMIPTLTKELNAIPGVEKAQYGGESVNELLRVSRLLKVGIQAFVLALACLSVFLIMATIKVSISNRKNEIAIMRNVGASNSYIKTPMIFEGIYIGLLSSLIPIVLTIFGYSFLYEQCGGTFFSNMLVLIKPDQIVYKVSAIILISGIGVGVISSFLATTKYMRWKR